jgi:hypothetical protein
MQGKGVRLPPRVFNGSGFNPHTRPVGIISHLHRKQIDQMMKNSKSNKAMNLKFSPDQIHYHAQHAGGFWSDAWQKIKNVGKSAVNAIAKPENLKKIAEFGYDIAKKRGII